MKDARTSPVSVLAVVLTAAGALRPARGRGGNFPAYRSKWRAFGPIRRRCKGGMSNLAGKPLEPGREAMSYLKHFHRRIANGVPYNAPNNRF